MTDYPQPQEGITGIDRTLDPLVTGQMTKPLIIRLARDLHRAVLFGSKVPANEETYERMTHPIAGDAVVVTDALLVRGGDAIHSAVGYLVARRREWWTSDEQWEQEKAEDDTLTEADRMVEPAAYYVQYGENPEDVCRWVNCTVLAIPVQI